MRIMADKVQPGDVFAYQGETYTATAALVYATTPPEPRLAYLIETDQGPLYVPAHASVDIL